MTTIITLTLISPCQVVRCQGDCLFCFQVVSSTTSSSTFHYSYVVVRCLYRHLPTKMCVIFFIRSHRLIEMHLFHISFYFFFFGKLTKDLLCIKMATRLLTPLPG